MTLSLTCTVYVRAKIRVFFLNLANNDSILILFSPLSPYPRALALNEAGGQQQCVAN